MFVESKLAWFYSLLLLYNISFTNAYSTANLRSFSEPAKILASLSNLRQDSFLDWMISILGPDYSDINGNQPLKRECPPCGCGTVNTAHRIVGGQETEVHEYPWMALLMWFGSFYCGATLISDQYAITAAHCVNGFYYRLITVRLLEHNRQNSSVKIVDRRVSRVFIHENYSTQNFDSDIALIRFTEPVKLGVDMHPVCMPTPEKSFAGQKAVVTGWGAITEGGPISDYLQEVEVPILSQDECRGSSYGASRITDNMICAGYVDEGGKDSCQGDSGGPMHVCSSDGKSYQLAGIVSWGEGCAKPGSPGVYTRVNQFNKWIEELTSEACSCKQIMEDTPEISSSSTTSTSSASLENESTTNAAKAE